MKSICETNGKNIRWRNGISNELPRNTLYDAEWIFFDIGSTLVDESECYKDRYEKAVRGSSVSPLEFE